MAARTRHLAHELAPPADTALRVLAGLALAAIALTTLPSPGRAAEVLRWDDIDPGELRSSPLALERPVELKIVATATVADKHSSLVAYPWILDSESRKVVWTIDPAIAKSAGRGRRNQGTRLVKQESALRLDRGRYEVYFTTYGDVHRTDITGWFGIHLGRRMTESHGGDLRPDDWKLELTCRDADASAVTTGNQARPRFSPLLRVEHPGNNAIRRVPFRLDAPASLLVYAIGEYDAKIRGMADAGWIVRADTRERIWEMTSDNSKLAGGAQKNRFFRDTVRFDAGTYLLCYSTDDSHAWGQWNLNPPNDPEFWGIALFDHDGARAHFAANVEDPFAGNVLVSLDRQPNNTFNLRGLRVRRPIQVRVLAVGEIEEGSGRFADYGWIEEARTHNRVWTMSRDNTRPAGGASKNRLADDAVSLAPGDYLICNWTDDSHAFGEWNAPPPRDPDSWGIQVWGVGKDFDRASVMDYAEDHDPKILAQLLGIGDDRHAIERFELKQKLKARVLAIGEGTGGQMFDYGWLKRVLDGGRSTVVWRMRYDQTLPAGGSDKNRRLEGELELEPGAYELHYVTDDSHSFQDWNADPPEQPHLWGVALSQLNDR
jgi:hypothetical protein